MNLEDFLWEYTTYDPDAMPEDQVPLVIHVILKQIYRNKLAYWYVRSMRDYPSSAWLPTEYHKVLYEERLMHPIIAIQEAKSLFNESAHELEKIAKEVKDNIEVYLGE